MTRRIQLFRQKSLWTLLVLVPLVIIITLILQSDGVSIIAEWRRDLSEGFKLHSQVSMVTSKQAADPCFSQTCPDDHFSFFIHSGAANVVAPKICIHNKMALGSIKNNAGPGINIVIVNGKTGEVVKTGHFDMYGGEVQPLVEVLQSIEKGAIVLMASFDDPSTKLNEEARKLIAELGSSDITTLGFRDNWVFVGGKGAEGKSSFEKSVKNDKAKNKYENWPELIDLQGCIPKYLD